VELGENFMHGISARKIATYKDICSFFSKSTFIYKRGFGGFRAYVLTALGSLAGRKEAVAELRPPKPARL
jgi:hypothetical protein